jgi:acyl-CoA reductase-like NAD-dependent aldehyde dehydrogenase
MYIGGRFTPAASGRSYELPNPSTEEVCAIVADGGAEDAARAVAAARRSFDDGAWRNTPVRDRAAVVAALGEGIAARREELTDILVRAHGAEYATLGVNLDDPIDFARRYAEAATSYPLDEPALPFIGAPPAVGPSMVVNGMTHRQPAGVCALVPTWNFPLFISMNKVAPALAMGCSVVVKPSPWGPLPDLVVAEILDGLGLPPGVFNVVTGASPELGRSLVEHPDVDMISFTGSAAVGREILRGASDTMKRVHLELGGKSALIVCDDAPLDEVVAEAALAAWFRAGQACALKTRVLVPEHLHDDLVDRMVEMVRSIVTVGDPADPSVLLGPLIRPQRRDAVEAMLATAQEQGAKVATGGGRPAGLERGWFLEPTVLAGVRRDMDIAAEEVFGPVQCVMPYRDVDEAIEIANDSRYGLSGSVYSADTGRAIGIAKRMRTGQVTINGGLHPLLPFGGFKQSGIGREMITAGFETFTELQAISWRS